MRNQLKDVWGLLCPDGAPQNGAGAGQIFQQSALSTQPQSFAAAAATLGGNQSTLPGAASSAATTADSSLLAQLHLRNHSGGNTAAVASANSAQGATAATLFQNQLQTNATATGAVVPNAASGQTTNVQQILSKLEETHDSSKVALNAVWLFRPKFSVLL